MRYLRSNTATRVTVGPFLDKTDGVTPEVALTVTSCKLTFMVDDAGVPTLVLDTNPTASGGNNDMVHVTGDDAGFYDLELTAANVNYVGRAMLALTDGATHCPVFHEFMILPAVVYDAMVAGTDNFDVSVTQWNGTNVATPDTAGYPKITIKSGTGTGEVNLSSGSVPVASIAANAITATSIASDAITAAKIADGAIDNATFAADTGMQTIRSGTAQAGAAGSITLDASASATTDYYRGAWILITGSTGAGQARLCTAYNGSTKVATVSPNWATNPTSSSTFAILPAAGVDAQMIANAAVSTSTAQLGVNVVNFGGSAGTFASGRPEVNVSHWKGTAAATADTAGYPVVTVKDGTGAGEIALTAGAVDVVTSLTNAPSDSSGVTTLLTRLSATRAGYLDNLSAGAVALESSVQTVLTKMLKYFQLALRKDSAIGTDNATEKNAINANGGSGAGSFDQATDSQEALRDRGDAAWVTATGFSTLDAAGVRSAVGLASANLDSQLGAIDDYIDTEIAAIKAKTDNLPASPAATGDIPSAATIADAVWDEATSGHTTSGSFGQALNIVRAGTAQAGGSTSITLDAGASSTSNIYNYDLIVITAGTGAGQSRYITAYDGSTKVATVATWQTNPSSDSVFVILPGGQIPGATAPTAADVADAVWDEATSGHVTAGSFGQALGIVRSGTAQAGSATSITLDAGASSTDSFYNYDLLFITAGTGAGQARYITAYNGSTKVATVGTWQTNPSSDSVFVILPAGQIPGATAPTAAEVADAVWDEDATAHQTQGSFGQAIGDPGSDTDTIWALANTNLDAAVSGRASQSSVDTLTTRLGTPSNLGSGATVAANLADIEAQTDDIGTAGAGLTSIPDSAGVGTLLSRLSSARAGYLDNLSGGAVATALKLKRYIQLLARKDAAIATDAATELGEVNENAGSGAGAYANTTDSQEALRDRGDSAWTTATGFSTLDAAGVRSAVGLASANLDTQLGAIDDYIDTEVAAIKAKTDQLTFTAAGQVDAQVMSAANNSLTAAAAASDLGTEIAAAVWANTSRTLSALGFTLSASDLAADTIGASELAADAITEIVNAVWTTALTEAYNTDGAAPTGAQALFVIMQRHTDFAISGNTITVKKLDGTTTAYTLTTDSADNPSTSARSS